MIFNRVENFDLRGFVYTRYKNEGFYLPQVGLLCLQEYAPNNQQISLWTRDYDSKKPFKLNPIGELVQISEQIVYQLDQNDIFLRLSKHYTERGLGIQFKFQAPRHIRILRQKIDPLKEL